MRPIIMNPTYQNPSNIRLNVIMGRPHPLIVQSMRFVLKETGYQPVSYRQMNHLASDSVVGTVVSTSVTNDQSMTFDQVLNAIRGRFPNIPLVVATIMNIDFAATMVEKIFIEHEIQDSVVKLSQWNSAPRALPGHAEARALLVHRDELEASESRTTFQKAIHQHFRLRSTTALSGTR